MTLSISYPIYIATICLSCITSPQMLAKGLDTLQPNEPASQAVTADEAKAQTLNSTKDPTTQATLPSTPQIVQPPIKPSTNPSSQQTDASISKTPSEDIPAETLGPEKFYMSSSLSWLKLYGGKGTWATGLTGDAELGYKIMSINSKVDLFGSLRYRPVESLIKSDQRQYRGIVETYLFGAKAKMLVTPKVVSTASAELGSTKTHIISIDSLSTTDQSLEKSGVDLCIGAGVSYLVLEKFALGTKLAISAGAYKTFQAGFELRYLL